MKKKFVVMMMSIVLAFSAVAGCGTSTSKENTTETTEAVEEATEEASEEATEEATEETTEEATEEATEATEEEAEATTFEVSEDGTVVDRSGNEIKLPEKTDAIISMAPSITRVLIDLGLADNIVACDTYSFGSYGSELKADIPQFDMMAPDQEQLVALSADVIFTTGMSQAGGTDVYESVRESGALITDIPSSTSLQGIEDDIRFIGLVVNKEDDADAMVSHMQTVIDQIAEIAATIPEEEKKSVLFELYTPSADNPVIYTAGNGTYINEMLELVGAKNIAANEADQWPALSEEAAVAANPDVILTADMYTPDVINTILTMEGWENVTAITNSDVYMLDSDEVNQPNQHVISALIAMAKAIYPEQFADFEESEGELEPAA
ncbi:MAG: ABC transporter substrate-binding protein [Butyrivibrio sp.]|nr:ABC transporter substrate-binding protein [Butyrivibrio sp.]